MKKVLLFILAFVFLYNIQLSAQDLIYKKDERIVAGKIISIDSSHVTFKEITDPEGASIKIPLTDISEIKFDYNSTSKNKNLKSDYKRAKNAVSFGLGGTGGIFSLNYDRAVFETPNFFLSVKGGIGSWLSQTSINAHITGNYNFGSNMHYLEFGLGAAVGLGQYSKYYRYYASVPILGYRFQPNSEGLFFRAYGTTFVMIQNAFNENFAVPMLAIDLGFCF